MLEPSHLFEVTTVHPDRCRSRRRCTIVDWSRTWLGGGLQELKRIQGWGHRAVCALIQIQHSFGIAKSTFLAGAAGGDYHLAEDIERETRIRGFGSFGNDLGENHAGNVFARGNIDDAYIVSALHKSRHFFEIDVPAIGRVVKAAILVFLDQNGFSGHRNFFHIMPLDIFLERSTMFLEMLQCSKTRGTQPDRRRETMTAAAKQNRVPVVEEVQNNTAIRDESTAFILRGMERIAEIQKQCIDLAVQQNTEMVEILKKAAEKVPGMPRVPTLEVTACAVTRYADTQKAAIDFLLEQSHVWTDMFNDRTSTVKKSTDSATSAAKQTLERSFAVQKKVLEHTAAHTKAVVDATRRQFGLTGTQADALTDTFQRGVDTVVEAQKELLDLVIH